MELFKQEKEKISKLLQWKSDNGIMETIVNTNYNGKLSQSQFTSILKKIKNSDFNLQSEEGNNTHLNISIRDSSIILKLYGDKNITKYCETNKIEDVIESVEILDNIRGRDNKFNINNYNLELELKDEKIITRKSARGAKVLSELFKYDKYYTYTKNYSFISNNELFQINFNISKSSSTEEFVNKGGVFEKKDIRFNKKKYVKKPKSDQRSFSVWWNSLQEDDQVELNDEKYNKKVSFKSLDNSGTLENELEYSVSVIYLGNSNTKIEGKTKKDKDLFVFNSYIGVIERILKILQQSDNLVSEYEIRQFKGKYKALTKQYNFRQSFPFSKTLETKNIIRLPNEEYVNNVNIRRNYCVTEKADGERNLLYIDDSGGVYLINRQELIRKTGLTIKNHPNTLLDGEYVTKLKGGYDVKLFLVFDLYFLDGEDFRERILMRMGKQKTEDSGIEKSRLEILGDMLKDIDIDSISEPMEIRKKEFLFGDCDEVSDNGQKRIEQYEIALDGLDKNSKDYKLEKNELEKELEKELKDTKIFTCSEEILDRIKNDDYEYETDGLIYTPVHLTVGEEPEIFKRNKYGGRWGRVFKWKKSDENSIDFQVEFAKNPNGEYIDKVFMEDMKKYRKVYLKVAYDKKNMLVNRAKIVNENPNYLEGYNSILFEPTTNFIPRTFECYLEITNNGGLVCKSNGNVGDVIKDNSIIEFYYDYDSKLEVNKDPRFRWAPMRKRDSAVPNSFETANNIWNTIFEPISETSICTGRHLREAKSEYYSGDKKEKNIFKSFHNLLKKSLLHNAITPAATLLDIGTGECGDLHKWLSSDLSYVVGIEHNNYNINNNINGGFKRIIQAMTNERYQDKELVKNIFLLWGDGGKNILDGSCGLDKLNKFYMDALWGNPIDREMKYLLRNPKLKDNVGRFKGGFNIVSCQFCMHYFFKNKTTLKEFLINISQNLMIGGKFIATCFDGRKIFKILEGKQEIEQKNEQGKVIWKIEKKYREKQLPKDETSLGLSVGVYVNTFNNMEDEYLVNIEYLEKILPEFGLELELCEPFEKHYNEFKANGTLEDELSSESKQFSFLNMTLTIVKKKLYEQTGGGEEQVDVERFLSNKNVLELDETEDYGLKILDDEEDDDNDDDNVDEESIIEEEKNYDIRKEMKTLDLGTTEPIKEELNIKEELSKPNLVGGAEEDIDLGNDELNEIDLKPVSLDLNGSEGTESLNEVELKPQEKVGLEEVQFKTEDLKEVELKPQEKGGLEEVQFKTEGLNEVELKPQQVSGLNEVELKPQQVSGLNEVQLKPQENEARPIVAPNVKVIKISADQGTLNMINK